MDQDTNCDLAVMDKSDHTTGAKNKHGQHHPQHHPLRTVVESFLVLFNRTLERTSTIEANNKGFDSKGGNPTKKVHFCIIILLYSPFFFLSLSLNSTQHTPSQEHQDAFHRQRTLDAFFGPTNCNK